MSRPEIGPDDLTRIIDIRGQCPVVHQGGSRGIIQRGVQAIAIQKAVIDAALDVISDDLTGIVDAIGIGAASSKWIVECRKDAFVI